MTNKYHTQIYNAKKAFIFIFPLFLLCIGILLYIGNIIRSFSMVMIFFIILCGIPFLFEKKIKSLFTKKVILNFDDLSIQIEISKIQSENVDRIFKYNWTDIKAYKFYFTPSKLTYLDIYTTHGFREFGFKDGKTQEESISSESILTIFRSYVKQYNLNKEPDKRIILKPGFLTTKPGTFFLTCIGILIIFISIFVLYKNPKSFPFLMMATFIFIPLLVKRAQDRKLYERMRELDKDSFYIQI